MRGSIKDPTLDSETYLGNLGSLAQAKTRIHGIKADETRIAYYSAEIISSEMIVVCSCFSESFDKRSFMVFSLDQHGVS